jgi:hypothetical protein
MIVKFLLLNFTNKGITLILVFKTIKNINIFNLAN